MLTPSFSQVFKFHVNKFKQNCSVSNKGTIFLLLVVYTTVTYLAHFENVPVFTTARKSAFFILIITLCLLSALLVPCTTCSGLALPQFIHPDFFEKEAVRSSQQTDTITASHGTARENTSMQVFNITPCIYFLTGWQLNVSPFVESVQPPGYPGL